MPDKTRLTVRLPPPLADEATTMAETMGVSLNAFLTLAVRNWVSYQKRFMSSTPSPPRPPPEAPMKPVAGREPMPKVGRNDPCPCGSGRKWKHCHGKT